MPQSLPTSDQDQARSGWIMWTAQERSPICGSALPGAGESTIAGTMRMQGSSAQVCAAQCPLPGEEMGAFKDENLNPGVGERGQYRGKDQRRRKLPSTVPVTTARLQRSLQGSGQD